jgi:hypothetical protein
LLGGTLQIADQRAAHLVTIGLVGRAEDGRRMKRGEQPGSLLAFKDAATVFGDAKVAA